jgi:hypothetical protein
MEKKRLFSDKWLEKLNYGQKFQNYRKFPPIKNGNLAPLIYFWNTCGKFSKNMTIFPEMTNVFQKKMSSIKKDFNVNVHFGNSYCPLRLNGPVFMYAAFVLF